jgi:hypothetical protein
MPTPMPTGAKGMAAVCFAVVGWITANAYVLNMPPEQAAAVGLFREYAAGLSGIIGWRVMGPSVGKSYAEAAGSGIKTVVVIVFAALLLFATSEMLGKSAEGKYADVGEAAIAIFQTMMDRSVGLLSVGVIGSMLIGGVIAGLLSENASRRWR